MDITGLLTAAANLAGRAARCSQQEWPKRSTWQVILDQWQGLRWSDWHLLAASGPDHWRALEAMFRATLALHPHTAGDDRFRVCATCVNLGEPDRWPCATLESLRPIAELVMRHLATV